MDDETPLQLNLSFGPIQEKNTRRKIFGNRSARIRSRRRVKFQSSGPLPTFINSSTEHNQQHARANGSKDRSSLIDDEKNLYSKLKNKSLRDDNLPVRSKKPVELTKRKSDDPRRQDVPQVKKHRPSVEFISSLFRNNPIIPDMPSSDVQALTEKVFSSKSFKDLDLHPHMVANLEQTLSLTKMTKVQRLAIPKLLAGTDALVKSHTGSGKTLAYGIPIVQSLQCIRPKILRSDGIYSVIIVPTRELALQSFEVIQKLVKPFQWVVPGILMGGEKKKAEKARLRKGVNILITTPGRLIDHIAHTEILSFSNVKWLVIDEADRLLELGFEKAVSQIISTLKEAKTDHKQTVLLSATLTKSVSRLAGMTLVSPKHIFASKDHDKDEEPITQTRTITPDESFAIPEHLQQYVVVVPCKLRLITLAAFLLWKCKSSQKESKIIVFLSTQDSVEFHHCLLSKTLIKGANSVQSSSDYGSAQEDDLSEDDVHLYKLYGDMPQKDRTKMFTSFCKADKGVLFCTDVAARGLDLPKVSWIVQYTTPGAATDYIHRVGRTARVGNQGKALLFLMPSEVDYITVLNKHKIGLEELSMESILKTLLRCTAEFSAHLDQSHMPRSYQEAASFIQKLFEEFISQNMHVAKLSRKAYLSFIRAYSSYPTELKSIFFMKALHLGHLAKSFALRDAPSRINDLLAAARKTSYRTTTNERGSCVMKMNTFEGRMFQASRGTIARNTLEVMNITEFSSGLSFKKNENISKSVHIKSVHAKSVHTKSGHAKSVHAKSVHTKSGHAKSVHAKSGHAVKKRK